MDFANLKFLTIPEGKVKSIAINGQVVVVFGETAAVAVSRKLVERTISGEYENDRVESIGTYAFYCCSALTTAYFPAATSIGNNAFSSCTKLTTADFPAVTIIGDYAFLGCSALTTADFPAATSIGNGAFQNCSKLTTVDFTAATSIGNSAFYSCSALTTADFPAATSIDYDAFRYCSKLTALLLRNTEKVVTLSKTNAVVSTPIASGTGYIYVPSALVDSYKAETNWSTYSAQFRALESFTVDGTTTGALDPAKI